MKKSKKYKVSKPRNWIAVHAFQRSGAGKHKSKKSKLRLSNSFVDFINMPFKILDFAAIAPDLK